MAMSRPSMKSHPFKSSPFSSKQHPNQLYSLGCAQSFGRLELNVELHMEFTSVRALFWLANEKPRERISVDAVRSVGPLRMIRRKVNGAAIPAGLRCVRHL